MTRQEPLTPGTPEEVAARTRAAGLLREMLVDVQRSEPAVPTLTLLRRRPDDGTPGARRVGRSSVVGVLVVGLLSVGGVAAASTGATSGPLHGLGTAVRSAAGSLTAALDPSPEAERPDQVLGRGSVLPSAASGTGSSAGPVPPSRVAAGVPAGAGAAQTAREVRALLRAAASALDAGQPEQAAAPLSRAEAVLAAGGDLPGRPALDRWATALRARLDAAATVPPAGSADRGTGPGGEGPPAPGGPPARPVDPSGNRPVHTPAPRPASPPGGPPQAPAKEPRTPATAPSPAQPGGAADAPGGRPAAPPSGGRPSPGAAPGKGGGGRGGG